MKVSIAGTGYVGLVSGVCLSTVGHDVVCIDIDDAKVALINQGRSPIYEPGLDELLDGVVGTRLRATTDLRAAVLDTDLTIIAVGTPFDGEQIDLTYIEQVSREIGAALAVKDGYHVVVVKSTVVPGTTEGLVARTLEEASGKQAGPGFGLGMNPEFLREGEAVGDFLHPDRIVLGGIDDRTRDVLAELYAPFAGVDVVRTTPTTAEMIKYAANSLLATLISYSNEIGNLCAAVGVDVTDALTGVHLDRRFSPIVDGRRITPGMTSYLWAGCGFGGSCFPKDVKALIAYGDRHGSPMNVLRSVIDLNAAQPGRMIDLLRRHLPDLRGRRVTVLGVAFKPGTDDIRESPGIAIVGLLVDAGAVVTVHDPVAAHEAAKVLDASVAFVDELADAVRGADAVVLTTRWEQYRDLDAVLAAQGLEIPVIDGRRMLDPDRFARYEGIGR